MLADCSASGSGTGGEIWVLGDVFVDVQAFGLSRLPDWDSDTESNEVGIFAGGSAANTARQLHSLLTTTPVGSYPPLSGRLRFFSAVGSDFFGQWFLDRLKAEGFPAEDIQVLGGGEKGGARPTSVCIVLTGKRDRAFVSCYASTDALQWEGSPLQAKLKDILVHTGNVGRELSAGNAGPGIKCPAHFHLGGFYNLKGLQRSEPFLCVLAALSRRCTISLSPQYDATGLWVGENEAVVKCLCFVDLLFVNETEFREMCAKNLFANARRGLLIVKTCGDRGCEVLVLVAGEEEDQKETEDVGDTAGAGGGIDVCNVGEAGAGKRRLADASKEVLERNDGCSASDSGADDNDSGGAETNCKVLPAMRSLCHVPVEEVEENKSKAATSSVVDTTGAGDAFAAGFLYYWIENRNREGDSDEESEAFVQLLRSSARAGNLVASRSVQKRGACETPIKAEDLPKWMFA